MVPNFLRASADFGHHSQNAQNPTIPCGRRIRTFNHSGQSEHFVISPDNIGRVKLAKHRHYTHRGLLLLFGGAEEIISRRNHYHAALKRTHVSSTYSRRTHVSSTYSRERERYNRWPWLCGRRFRRNHDRRDCGTSRKPMLSTPPSCAKSVALQLREPACQGWALLRADVRCPHP